MDFVSSSLVVQMLFEVQTNKSNENKNILFSSFFFWGATTKYTKKQENDFASQIKLNKKLGAGSAILVRLDNKEVRPMQHTHTQTHQNH